MKTEEPLKLVLGLFVILVIVLTSACGLRRVAVPKSSRPPKKIVGKGVYHVVERHQTLYRICKTYGVDLQAVARLNRIRDPGQIDVGQRIFIPGATRVLEVDVVLDDVVSESEKGGREKIASVKPVFAWPVAGRVTDIFEDDESKRHMGVDIAAPLGTPIKASGSGKVIYSGNTIRGYGNLIIIRHSDDYVTVYAHNHSNLVDEGMWVERGQVIGKVGQTGRASGPHVHFEIRTGNQAVDPMPYLK
jgi:murein DD-endopeptidase MepM/ murein hydrolase activator NlpD